MKLQKLTSKGMTKMEQDLTKFYSENKVTPQMDIKHYESEEISEFNITIDKNKLFDNKLSVGKYFLHIFPDTFEPCNNTWNWLSVLYYNQLLNLHGKVGELRRLFISDNYSYYPYRHLLKAPYDICRFYKDNLDDVKFLLLDKVNKNSTFYRRIAENQDIIKNPEFMKVARQFFYDEKTKSIKDGVTDIIQRLIKVWKQYERSFDMYRMPAEDIIKKLLKQHDEFQLFLQK